MNILGVACDYHDASAALLCNGELAAASAEERFSRRKHDPSLPVRAIDWCLQFAGLTPRDLDYVAFYEKPLLKFDRVLTNSLTYYPRAGPFFREGLSSWLSEKLWIKSRLLRHLGIPAGKVLFCDHHCSHAASAFYCSGLPAAAILTVDGVGEWATATMGVGQAHELRLQREIRWPHSLGLLYSTLTAFLGFEVNEGEFKVMGLAAFGTPRYEDKIRQLVRVSPDGALELDLDYFCHHLDPSRMFSQPFLRLFGDPRDAAAEWFADPAKGTFGSAKDQYYADLAASLQSVTEDMLLRMACHALRSSSQKDLVMAGGVALNSKAIGRIQDESGVRTLYVQPAAGDCGGSLGAALWVWHSMLGKPPSFAMRHAYWGGGGASETASAQCAAMGFRAESLSSDGAVIERAVDDLLAGKVIGWCQGRFEWGPRALGHRSILADPRSRATQDLVNRKVKFREPFRPFGPSLLASSASRYFDAALESQPVANFMQRTALVREDAKAWIPATTHVDGTSRPHLVRPEDEPLYAGLLRSFGQATGHPVLLNTSFNVRGEPIVGSAADALQSFASSNLDVVYIERMRVTR